MFVEFPSLLIKNFFVTKAKHEKGIRNEKQMNIKVRRNVGAKRKRSSKFSIEFSTKIVEIEISDPHVHITIKSLFCIFGQYFAKSLINVFFLVTGIMDAKKRSTVSKICDF